MPDLLRQRAGAVLAALADPDRLPPQARTRAWLFWGLLLSLALHTALLSWINSLPFSLGGPVRLALSARLMPLSVPSGETTAVPAPASAPPAAARAEAKPQGAPAMLPHPYFGSREVDATAQVLEKPPLIYPENPYMWKLAGTVRVRVYIGEDGKVDAAELVSAEPPGYFEEAALVAARQIRYRPAELRGRPVRSRKLIEIVFDPHEALHAASGAARGR